MSAKRQAAALTLAMALCAVGTAGGESVQIQWHSTLIPDEEIEALQRTAAPQVLEAPVEVPLETMTPGRETCGREHCFWETPMEISDTEAVWQALTQPITLVKGTQGKQALLRAEPSEEAEAIGEITMETQGLHVLEERDGWTRVETYSSSFPESSSGAWNKLLTGWIRSDRLETREVKTNYALLVDKQTQKLYVFEHGTLLDTLTVSTGTPAGNKPYNETRSGEYLLYSRVGTFPSGDLTCRYGMRFNAGDLIHEVPYVKAEDGSAYYGKCEPYLGQKASHGCIRVQRQPTPGGHNAQWLWNTLATEMGSRIAIWEDWEQRVTPAVAPDTPLYYNPNNGVYYHADAYCASVKSKYLPLTHFTYAELDRKPYSKLKRCLYCFPPVRNQKAQ